MQRLHIHLAVIDLTQSTAFYSALFGQSPTKLKPGYAKWQLDDPRINFAISAARQAPGLDHLGLEFESAEALKANAASWRRRELQLKDPSASTCCYANSEKTWLKDPQNISWEAFTTVSEANTFLDKAATPKNASAACCGPAAELS